MFTEGKIPLAVVVVDFSTISSLVKSFPVPMSSVLVRVILSFFFTVLGADLEINL